MDRVFDTYGALLPQMQAWVAERFPQQAGDSDFVYRQATRAKSLDALRGLLPAASLSNIGIYGTGQSYEQLLLRMRAHPLPEARHYADMMLYELRKVIPSFLQRVDVPARGGEWSDYLASTSDRTARLVSRLWPELGPLDAPARDGAAEPEVTLLDFDPDGEEKVLVAACFSHLGCSEREAARRVRLLGHDDRVALLDGVRRRPAQPPASARTRLRAHRLPLRARHRLRRLPRPAAPPHAHAWSGNGSASHSGTTCPSSSPTPDSASATTKPSGGPKSSTARCVPDFPEQASYVVALAHRIRYVMQFNAREAMHLIELRSGAQGHPAYRRVAQQMHRAIAEVAGHRALAEAMTFVDHGATDLERLESERRAERRRSEKSATH